MMTIENKWTYAVEGKAANGQTWKTSGVVTASVPIRIADIAEEVMKQSFYSLTEGNAVYGKPGVGCNGPYELTRFLLEIANE